MKVIIFLQNIFFLAERFTRFDCNSAPEVFQKKNEANFGDIDGVVVICDDIIIAAIDEQKHESNHEKTVTKSSRGKRQVQFS